MDKLNDELNRWEKRLYSFGAAIFPMAIRFRAFMITLNLFVNTIIARNLAFIVRFFFVMGAVAYFTLLERKLLGYFQLRVGPNKVGIKGLGQPIADAMKLFLKEFMVPDMVNRLLFVMGPCLIFTICVGV